MDQFINYYKEISIKKGISALIKCNTKSFNIMDRTHIQHTYVLDIKKFKNEDDVYSSNPELLDILPRACSLLVSPDGSVEPLMGPSKFAGKRGIDEDPDDEEDETIKDNGIFDFSKVQSWANDNILEIVETTKENGKFWIFRYTKDGIIMCGSKNYHIAFLPNEIDKVIEENKKNDIMLSGLLDIKDNLVKLTNPVIHDIFCQGYSLVGELCDGQHFFPGQGDIKYFGFFMNGKSMETMSSLSLLQSLEIKTVDFKMVFSQGSDPKTLEDVFKLSRCMNSEGAVLRCRNVLTGEIILVKSKAVKYIVWRMIRQVLLRGSKNIEHIKKRFIDTYTYHGLNTRASIRIVRQLMNFGLWMISKEYPCAILGHRPIQSVRSKLTNGFCTYWTEYINAGNDDIDVSLDDFGAFDMLEFLANTEIYEKRMNNDPVYVFFFQGLQGSGKSTRAALLCDRLNAMGIKAKYREQDIFWSDTESCQGAIHHDISRADGPKVVIISRCNANPKQYERYLQMLYKLPCIVSFISPDQVDPLYLMISLSGIINRSMIGDNLMVGRFEYPISEVIDFTRRNFKDFVVNPAALTISTHQSNEALAVEAMKLKTNEEIETFVKEHYSELCNLRLPIEDIVDQTLGIIQRIMSGDVSHVVYNQNPIYVGVAVSPHDKLILQDFVNHNHLISTSSDFTSYLHHCTLEYEGGKKKVSSNQIKPGQHVTGVIDALVIRKSDGASAFRFASLMIDDQVVKVQNRRAHVTAKIPSSCKPMCSNDFIDSTDESIVDIIPFHHIMNLICFYFS